MHANDKEPEVCGDKEDSKASLLGKEQEGPTLAALFEFSDKSYETDHLRAQVVAAVGLVFNLSMMILAAMVAVAINSSMMFVLSSQHLLDAIGDALVLWRFWCDPDDPNYDKYDCQGSVLVSFAAMGACIYVITFSSRKLVHQEHPHFLLFAVFLSTFIFVVAFTLGLIKMSLASAARLNSYTLHMDAITSLFVSSLAVIYVAASVVYKYEESTWFIEHATSLVLAIFLFFYAMYNLWRSEYKGTKWYSTAFWKLQK